MPIPNDPDKRWWVEVSAHNPARVEELRPAMLAFVAFSPGREANLEGCGFIIAGHPEFAAVITARHVLLEGVFRTQQPIPAHASSALFVRQSSTKPSINPEKLKVLWMGSQNCAMMDVRHVGYNETLDVACCVITPHDLNADSFEPVALPIDTAVPRRGEIIHMVSLDNLTVNDLVPSSDKSGVRRIIRLTRRVSIRVGVVTGVYPRGFRQYRWPCFTTSIPAEPGMSGGLVVLPRAGKTIAACGIVCADNSTVTARTDCFQCGESVIACAWPVLALRAPESIPSTPETTTRSLYEFMRSGDMTVAVGGIDHIDMIELDNGDCRIGFR
jgi:hypothetical protein